jgi:DNA invertase Pin-like site-specific DNA recombinase
MLEDLREGGDVIVVWKLDRRARSTRHLLETMETIRNRGQTTHAGKMIMTVFAALRSSNVSGLGTETTCRVCCGITSYPHRV